jgi:lipoprotein LprG
MQTMMRRAGRRTIGLIFIALLGLSLAACSGGLSLPTIPPTTGGSPTAPPSTASTGSSSAPVASRMAETLAVAVSSADPQAQAIVDDARARLDQVNAVHYLLTIDGDLAIDAAKTLKIRSAEGDLLRPDKASATAKVAIGPVNATVRFMQIGNDSYMTNLLTGKWEKAPGGLGFDPSVVLDSQNGVASMLSKISGWQYIESTQVDGVDTQHLRGSVPVEAVNAFLAGSMRGDAVDVDLYVAGQNNDMVRFVIAEQPAAVTPGTVVARWTLDLSNQNGNISILPPI